MLKYYWYWAISLLFIEATIDRSIIFDIVDVVRLPRIHIRFCRRRRPRCSLVVVAVIVVVIAVAFLPLSLLLPNRL